MKENRFLKEEMKTVAKRAMEAKDSGTRVRKKLFAENSELKKRMFSLEERLEILEKNICRGIKNVD